MAITIKDDTIAAVTKIALIEAGPSVRVINANGAFIIPGLWDMSARLGHAPDGSTARSAISELYVAHGITGIRDLDSASIPPRFKENALQPEMEAIYPAWLQSQTTSVRDWISSQRIINGLAPIFEACASGAAKPLASPGISSECRAHNARQIFLQLKNADTWIVPDLVSTTVRIEAFQPVAENRAHASRVHASNDPGLERSLQRVNDMHRSGVQFLAGTNQACSSSSSWVPLQRELELLVETGLTPIEALQAATYNSAPYMAKLNRFGVVEANHAADLVVLAKNPLEDIHNAELVQAVILRGKYLSRAELDRLLADAETHLQGAQESTALNR